MARFAAFDVGTNTVLMAVAERNAAGQLVPLLERSDITRLGEGVDRTGRLAPEAVARTARTIATFAADARALGVTRFAAGATSAARDAQNREELLRAVRDTAALDLEILSGDQEAALVYRAVQADFGARERTLLAVDIGGGSTELIVGPTVGAATFRRSLDVGSVRLTERFISSHPIPSADQQAVRALVRAVLSEVPRVPPDTLAVAVAATATTLHAMASAEARPTAPGTDAVLHTDILASLLDRLAALSLEERRRLPGLDPRRADVVCTGGFILLEVLRHHGLSSCSVTDRGVRWGLLHERFGGPAWN